MNEPKYHIVLNEYNERVKLHQAKKDEDYHILIDGVEIKMIYASGDKRQYFIIYFAKL